MQGQEIVGRVAAELLDELDADTDETAEIAEVFLVCRINTKLDNDGEEVPVEDPGWSFVRWRASDPVWTHQVGLLEGCLEGMRKRRGSWREETGDDEDE